MRRTALAFALFLLLASRGLHAGVYNLVEEVRTDQVDSFAIVHPIGYTDLGGVIPVRVCVEPSPNSDLLIHPVQKALRIWNELEEVPGNCASLEVWQDLPMNNLPCLLHEVVFPPDPARKPDVLTTLIHELGHCGVGLGHIDALEYDEDPVVEDLSDPQNPIFAQLGRCDLDMPEDGCCFERRSFTNSINVQDVDSSQSAARGERTDEHLNNCPFGGTNVPICLGPDGLPDPIHQCPDPAECCPDPVPGTPIDVEEIHWYRIADNDPFITDGTVIDMDTYSRSVNNLPADSTYAESANGGVGLATGYLNTQSVMYAGVRAAQFFYGLSSDDINMMQMAMTGDDRTADTLDDYVVDFQYVDDCAQADIVVKREVLPNNLAGRCENSKLTEAPGQGFLVFHYVQEPISGSQLEITIGDQVNWYYGPQLAINGTCPGPITLEITGALPNTNVTILRSLSQGRTPIPAGDCAGLAKIDLATPQVLTTITVDEDGVGSQAANVPAGACGAFLQALDTGTCVTGPVESVP